MTTIICNPATGVIAVGWIDADGEERAVAWRGTACDALRGLPVRERITIAEELYVNWRLTFSQK